MNYCARIFTAFALLFTGVSLTVSGQIDFADTTNVETKEYIHLDVQGILDSLDMLEAGSLTLKRWNFAKQSVKYMHGQAHDGVKRAFEARDASEAEEVLDAIGSEFLRAEAL